MARFTFDPQRSEIGIHASSSIHPIHTTTPVSGWIDGELVPGGATIDAARPVTGEVSFDLGGMRSGNPLIDREAERRLHIRRFPTVTGALTSFAPGPDGEPGVFVAAGALTFHGTTREISGSLRVEIRDGVLGVTGTTEIDVTDFGVQPPSLLLVKVHKDVRVVLEAFASGA